MKRIPLVDTIAEFKSLKREMLASLTEVLESGSYVLGSHGERLEKEIASFVQTKHAVSVANGTDALILSLEALGVGLGDEVITTPFTFFATAEAIARVGATPVFVDIEEESFNIKFHNIESALTPATKAILVVHLFGQCADMGPILELANRHGLHVIEDACQAIGASYQGKMAGSIGDIGCFSFYPSKNLGAFGDGGMVVTNDPKLAEKVQLLRNHGSEQKYKHAALGYNSRLDEIQAAFLLIKIQRLSAWNENRREIAERYTSALSNVLNTPVAMQNHHHVYHQYCIRHPKRDELAHYLRENYAIDTAVYYPIPLHLQQAFQHLGYQKGDFPIAEKVSDEILALPIHPTLSKDDQDRVIEALLQYVGDPDANN
jgi:UDP-2-acetamido-2-deoxy-ribo-hexuluronate aminotransferase